MSKISESIFKADGKLIPLAEVGYVLTPDLDHKQVNIIFKYSDFDRDLQCMNPMLHLMGGDAEEFLDAWEQYRHEVDGPFEKPE